jgi:hypothetical protein
MARRIGLALLGGGILFVWGFVTHVVIGLYDPVFQGFADEAEVTAALERNAPAAGLYYLPAEPERGATPQTEAFVNLVPAGQRTAFGPMMGLGLLAHASTVFLVLTLLAGSWPAGYGGRVARFSLAGLALAFAVHSYYWVWFDFPGWYFALSLGDSVVGWTLVGLALAKLVSGRR